MFVDKCPRCNTIDRFLVMNGPHIQHKCTHCGKHVKFISPQDVLPGETIRNYNKQKLF